MKEGIGRINFVIRFLSAAWLFCVAALLMSNGRADDVFLLALFCLPAAAGFTLAWIIDGFAGIKMPSDEMRPWWYWALAGAILVLLTAI